MADYSFILNHAGLDYRFEVEAIHNEILNEVYYSVTYDNHPPCLMAWDIDKARLVRQGSAPYIVYELENLIAQQIEWYNLEHGA